MDKRIISVLGLLFSVLLVHAGYVIIINPEVSQLSQQALSLGEPLPRDIFIILKDLEQEICLILFAWSIILCLQKYLEISSLNYVFEADLFEDELLDANKAMKYLSEIEKLDSEIRTSGLVEILGASLRRFALTRNIESAASAI